VVRFVSLQGPVYREEIFATYAYAYMRAYRVWALIGPLASDENVLRLEVAVVHPLAVYVVKCLGCGTENLGHVVLWHAYVKRVMWCGRWGCLWARGW
jgi:hypothetical protein